MTSGNSPSSRSAIFKTDDKNRVLILGLDGVSFDLLRPWLSEGHLPTLERLIRDGVKGDLESVVPPLSASAWTSFATGNNPGKHGIIDFVIPRTNSYEVSLASSETNVAKTFWELLSEKGKGVGIVGVPMTYPPSPVNGYMICSFMTPNLSSKYTYPAALKTELTSQGVPYLPTLRETHRSSHVGKFLAELALSTQERVASILYLLREKHVDLFCTVFQSPDLIQHELWRVLDEQHPKHDPKEAEEYGRAILDFFVQLDDYIAQIIEAMGKDVTVILMSDHGFGPATHFFYVNNWLLQEGFLVVKRNLLSRLKYLAFKMGFTPMNTFKILTSLKLAWLRQYVRFGRNYKEAKHIFFSFFDIDWEKTKAFAVGNYGQIYINLKGKRPKGFVEPGQEYEQLKVNISQKLHEIVDPTTGERVVDNVIASDELYSDDRFNHGPYLIPITRNGNYVSFGASDFGSNRIIEVIHGMSGYHRKNGILIMYGEHIQSGTTLDDAKLIDLAPTVLYTQGIPIPKEMDGKILTQAFTEDFLASNKPIFSEVSVSNEIVEESYTGEESDQLKERLRDLGYLA